MLIKSVLQSALLSLVIICSATSGYAADDPSMQQIYDTAKAGKLDEAQTMIQKVLQDHPNSAKAHFVEAELLAKQGRFASAEDELGNADRLAPGLPFAKPEAVENLRRLIATAKQHPGMVKSAAVTNYAPVQSSGTPWGLFIVLAVLIGFIIMAVKFMSNRNPQPMYVQNGAGGYGPGAGPGMPMQPYGGVGGGSMMGGGGGIGSGIVGGLVTGAALGAGMVAGEELMHHFTDGDRHNSNNIQNDRDDYVPPNDMGGNDFGIADNSSWDSGGGGGGDSGGGDW